jgi:hypothetical protein
VSWLIDLRWLDLSRLLRSSFGIMWRRITSLHVAPWRTPDDTFFRGQPSKAVDSCNVRLVAECGGRYGDYARCVTKFLGLRETFP